MPETQPDIDTHTHTDTDPDPDLAGPSPTTPIIRRPVRSYVLRGGRMGTGQVRALKELAPQYVLPFQPGVPADFDAVFGRRAARVLEVGFGMGDATAQVAAAHPELDFIGVEVHVAGVGALLKRIGDDGLTNLRIVQHDAVEVLGQMVSPDSLQAVHVWFPDPWHKARHHKRRLVQPAFVALAASRLAPGGRLHLATDWVPYAEQMLEVLQGEPLLVNSAPAGGFCERPALRPLTKFEQRGLKLGHGVRDLVFLRR